MNVNLIIQKKLLQSIYLKKYFSKIDVIVYKIYTGMVIIVEKILEMFVSEEC